MVEEVWGKEALAARYFGALSFSWGRKNG